MSVLTAERSVSRKGANPDTGSVRVITVPLKTGAAVFKGGVVGIDNTTGYGVSGTGLQATTVIAVGIALKSVTNAGASGSVSVDVERGLWPLNILGGDTFGQAKMGQAVFLEDDQTVRATNGTSTRSAAGTCWGLDENGLALVELGIRSATGL